LNFFQAQDQARRKTWQLALLFMAAVLSLIVLTNLLVAAVYLWSGNTAYSQSTSMGDLLQQLPAETWILISFGVIGVVGVASLYKFLVVRGGGRAIAESLGGNLLTRDTADAASRRLLNVVEEMAIAAGVPVPPVYLIEEPSINAFAAGFGPDDAVIGINRGTIEHLSRDELQGVVAHEFSHILNGDMNINLRLIAILHGILFLGIVGYVVLRGAGLGGRRSNNAAPMLALGIGLLVIGFAGTFFGNLIKAAVSRQREYLADAAAVQFTRNPDGISGALKKIGGLSEGSSVTQAAASEMSHMFFGQIDTFFLNSLMSTHPPLAKRIAAIDPGWDGVFPEVDSSAVLPAATDRGSPVIRDSLVSGFSRNSYSQDAIRVQIGAAEVADTVGTLDNRGLDAARSLIASTNEVLKEAAHDPWGCRGLIYAILLDPDPSLRDRQFGHLQAEAERGVPAYTQKLVRELASLDAPRRLALVGMAMPALKSLSNSQYQRFSANVVALIKMDQVISLPEWVLHRLLVKELQPHFDGTRPPRPRYNRLSSVAPHVTTLLSTLSRFGQSNTASQAQAFNEGAKVLELDLVFDASEDANFVRLNEAIRELRLLKPLVKPKLIKACAATALADGHISGTEGALLQGFAAALDCPLPPSIYSNRTEH